MQWTRYIAHIYHRKKSLEAKNFAGVSFDDCKKQVMDFIKENPEYEDCIGDIREYKHNPHKSKTWRFKLKKDDEDYRKSL